MKLKLWLLALCFLILVQGCTSTNWEGVGVDSKTFEIADFAKVSIGMTRDEIIELVGEPSRVTGFNFVWLIYDLADESKMKLLFYPGETLLGAMNIVDPDGRIFALEQAD